MKSTLLHTGIIVGASVVVALVYNALQPEPLPLAREERTLQTASDADLFDGLGETSVGVDTAALPENTIPNAPNPPDNTQEIDLPEQVESLKPSTSQPGAETKTQQQPQAQQQARTQQQAREHQDNAVAAEARAVTYEQVARLAKDSDVLFIDARNAEEFAQGHIRSDAMNIYTPEFEQHIPEIIGLPRDKRIVVYCGGGACELSHELADHLRNFGFTKVFVYTGGWDEWKRKQGGS